MSFHCLGTLEQGRKRHTSTRSNYAKVALRTKARFFRPMLLCAAAYTHKGSMDQLMLEEPDFQAKRMNMSTSGEFRALHPGYEEYPNYQENDASSYYTLRAVS